MKPKQRVLQGFSRVAVTSFVAATCVVASLFLPSHALAADAPPAADVAAQVEIGRKTYTSYCTRCHGIRLVTGGLGFDLRTFPSEDKPRFVRAVTNGVRAMPAWGGVLKTEDIDAVWAYIGSVNGWASALPVSAAASPSVPAPAPAPAPAQ